MKYMLTQLDGEDSVIDENHFDGIPTLEQFADVAYYVDRVDIKPAYKELIESIGDWVHVAAGDEDGIGEFYVDEGVWFKLECMQ